MCISGVISRMFYIRDTFHSYVAITYQDSAILESFNRAITCRIAEFMAVHCAVNEIVCTIKFTHGACFKERMSLIRSTDGFLFASNSNIGRSIQYRQHIRRIKFKTHRAMFCRFRSIQKDRVSCQCKTCIQIQFSIIIHKDTRIKLERLIFLADCDAVTVFYIAIEFVLSCRLITYSYRNHLGSAHKIIQVKSSVRSLYHIRRCKAICKSDSRCCRILFSFVNAALITPVAQIIYRCRPTYIITQTEIQSVEYIMRTVNIYPISNNMRFCIRNIFPAWHVWIQSLFCLHVFPPISYYQFHNPDFTVQNL